MTRRIILEMKELFVSGKRDARNNLFGHRAISSTLFGQTATLIPCYLHPASFEGGENAALGHRGKAGKSGL